MKIEIIGSVGSGKTTLARKLSLTYDIPFYEMFGSGILKEITKEV